MNASYEISIKKPLNNLPKPKQSFAFDKDISLILSSLGTNHAYLDQWQMHRKTLILSQMTIIESIYQQVLKICDISIQKTDLLIEFLRLKSLQLHKYANSALKPLISLKSSDDISLEQSNKLNGDPFSEIFGKIDCIQGEIHNKTQDFSNLIDQKLLKAIILEEQRNFTSLLSKYKAKVLIARKRLDKLDQEAEAHFNFYIKAYDELVKEVMKKKKPALKKSIYSYEHEFLSLALDHEKLFHDYGVMMTAFFNEILLKERNKMKNLKEVFGKYYLEFISLFETERDSKVLDELIQLIKPNEMLERAFDLKTMLSEKQMMKTFKSKEATFKDLELFIQGFKLKDIIESELILGKFPCMRKINVVKTKETNWVDGIAIITKDSWLLINNDVMNMYKQPDYVLNLNRCSFNNRSDEMFVVINEKNKGWCKKDYMHWIKLDSNSERENFVLLLKGGNNN